MNLCIFCLRDAQDQTPWCTDNPGKGCTYGFYHEVEAAGATVKQEKAVKVDKKLCAKCGLHPENPKSKINGCAHEYN